MNAYPEYKESGIDWLGKIPSHWEIVRIGLLFDIKAGGDANPELYSECQDTEHPYPVYTNSLIENQIYAYTSLPTVRENSITVTGRGDIGHAFFRKTKFDAIIRLLALTPVKDVDGRYYTYFIDTVIPFFSDSAAVGQLSAKQMNTHKVTLPTRDEQKAIAAYLDEKTGKIDELIAEKTKQVEDLRSYRTSVITEAVTHGLNPNAPLRQSGIDWLGEIPEHWNKIKLKYIADLKSGSNITADSLISNGFPVYGGNGIRGYCADYNTEGDFALIGRQGALCGNVNYAHGKFWATEHAVVCFPIKPYALSWFGSLLEIMNLNQYSLASAQPGLSVERIKNLLIPVPPISEQQEIADYLDEKTAKIDKLISELNNQLAELAEYKQAVISEAVTGKVDVRDYKSSL
jgi:type I restriction enzyme S subunit